MVASQMGDHYLLCSQPTLRFLWSPILSRLYITPSDETANWDSLCVYGCKKTTNACPCQRPCSPRQSSVDYGNTKTTKHALKVSESSESWSWTQYRSWLQPNLAQSGSTLLHLQLDQTWPSPGPDLGDESEVCHHLCSRHTTCLPGLLQI